MERYEIAIIGTGPAGLEAAITAKARNKRILLIGSAFLSEKVEKAHTIKNYLGLSEVSGEQMQAAFLKHLEQMEITITEDRINTVYAMGKYFVMQGHRDMYEADSVVLACGMSVGKPLPGELENLGNGVSYCATCDGALYKGKSTVVIGYSKEEEGEVEFLAELADEVIYLPMYPDTGITGMMDGRVKVIKDTLPLRIEKREGKIILCTDKREIDTDCVFVLREHVAPGQLVPGLKLDKNHVAVNRSLETNILGMFACGDITGTPYQYIKAAGEGNVAALSAVRYLSETNRK